MEAAGFKRVDQQDIHGSMSSLITPNFSLEVGAATESVTVTAEASPLNTANADLGQVISQHMVDRGTPNVRRNASSLALMAPGVTGDLNCAYTDNSNTQISVVPV